MVGSFSAELILAVFSTYCLWQTYSFIRTDASVNFTSSTYRVNEGDSTVSVCASLYNIPADGLECQIEVSLETIDGLKAGLLLYSPYTVGISNLTCA